MAETRYFMLPAFRPAQARLLRERDDVSEMFMDGHWQRTGLLLDYLFGNDTTVKPITEAQARAEFPEAFA